MGPKNTCTCIQWQRGMPFALPENNFVVKWHSNKIEQSQLECLSHVQILLWAVCSHRIQLHQQSEKSIFKREQGKSKKPFARSHKWRKKTTWTEVDTLHTSLTNEPKTNHLSNPSLSLAFNFFGDWPMFHKCSSAEGTIFLYLYTDTNFVRREPIVTRLQTRYIKSEQSRWKHHCLLQ